MLSTEQKAKPVDQLKRIGANLLKGLLSAFVALGYMAAVAKVIWGGIDQQPDLFAYASLLLVIVAFVLGIIMPANRLAFASIALSILFAAGFLAALLVLLGRAGLGHL